MAATGSNMAATGSRQNMAATVSSAQRRRRAGMPLVAAAVLWLQWSRAASAAAVVYAGLGGFVGGAGGLGTAGVARWDGSSWSALLGGSLGGGAVTAVEVIGDLLYAGGNVTFQGAGTAGGDVYALAQWDGNAWAPPFGSGGVALTEASRVFALEVYNGDLYFGGRFTVTYGGASAPINLGVWDGTTVSKVGPGSADNTVYTLLATDGGLYVGGAFTTIGGYTIANGIAQWNGVFWTAFGTGMNGPVLALAVYYGALFAGGAFTTASGASAPYIARWNGASWDAVDSGTNGPVHALAQFNYGLYVGGSFSDASGVAVNNIALWNNNAWSAVGDGLNDSVNALTLYNYYLWAGGPFAASSTNSTPYAAIWEQFIWNPAASGPPLPVTALYSGCDLGQLYPSCLTPGAVAGIVIAAVFGTALVLLLLMLFMIAWYRREDRRAKARMERKREHDDFQMEATPGDVQGEAPAGPDQMEAPPVEAVAE